MALEKEFSAYQDALESLAAEEGRFVLVHGTNVVGVFDTYEDALQEGYKEFELEPFLVKQIKLTEQAHLVTRKLDLPCRT